MTQQTPALTANFLDRTVPLDGASHADVVSYGVDVPLRYAQCFAMLNNGRRVRLRNGQQFMGWSGSEENRCLLFGYGTRRILVSADARELDGTLSKEASVIGKFIGRDGNLLFVRDLGRAVARNMSERMSLPFLPGNDRGTTVAGAAV